MLSFKDMTFCKETTCSKFGDDNDDCPRSLTLAVEHLACHWWDKGNKKDESAPICVFTERPDCYEIKK